MDLHVINVSLV